MQGIGAVGMNVHCDGASNKVEIRTCKRSSHFLRVPTVIESAIGHRVAGWENLRALIINHRDADFVQLPRNFREPLLAQVSRASAAVPPSTYARPQSAFFSVTMASIIMF